MGANIRILMLFVRLALYMHVFGRFGFRYGGFGACESVLRTRGSTKPHMHFPYYSRPYPIHQHVSCFHQCLYVLSLEGIMALHIGLTSALSRLGASGSPPRRWLSSSGVGVGSFCLFSSFSLVQGSQVGF